MRPIEDYLIQLEHDEDADGVRGWVAEVVELPGCASQGTTPTEAIERLRDAFDGWMSVAVEDGRAIPEPRSELLFSGKLLLRMPRSLHAQLAQEAEREGTSLNQFVTAALSAAVSWRAERHSVSA